MAGPPTTAPYTVAMACKYQSGAIYDPNEKKIAQRIELFHSNYEITGLAYDASGDLYVGINTPTDSWVDEYSPGFGGKSRHISDGIHHPGPMIADPDGDLIVANIGVLSRDIVIYKPGSTKPDISIHDINYAGGLVFAEGHLWVSDYSKNKINAYHLYPAQNKAVLAWVIDRGDVHGPSDLAATAGKLWVLNVPSLGADYVQVYKITDRSPPDFFKKIDARVHSIAGLATDPVTEDAYFSERGNKYEVSVYDKNGDFLFSVDKGVHAPGAIVASPTRYYVANATNQYEKGNVVTFTGKDYDGELELPPHCDNRPSTFAIMRP